MRVNGCDRGMAHWNLSKRMAATLRHISHAPEAERGLPVGLAHIVERAILQRGSKRRELLFQVA